MNSKSRLKILIFIVAYNHESCIESVLDRIPDEIWDQLHYETKVLIIDDASMDKTTIMTILYKINKDKTNLVVLQNPVNQGYGGNQKIGYHYAIENDFDIVVLLHGDGQYAPENLLELIKPIVEDRADAVFGSRMLNKRDALKGGMPLYKFIGNQLLTKIQNILLKSNLSEFHSGYRVYSVDTLRRIPFQYNSNDFDFDTDIIIQLLDNGLVIHEVPIPTYYGDEICYVNGLKYAKNIIKSTIHSRLQSFNIFYTLKFDYTQDNTIYSSKIDFLSSHKFAVDEVERGSLVLDIGCGSGCVAKALKEKGCKVFGADHCIQRDLTDNCFHVQEIDLNGPDSKIDYNEKRLDAILLLDILEHLHFPEGFLITLREQFAQYKPKVIITTANIAFIIMRLSLLIGEFNYGKRGVLDVSHRRLFTFKSIMKTLKNSGYSIDRMIGLPIPFPLIFGRNRFSAFLLFINMLLIKLSKSLFSYQIAVVGEPTHSLSHLLEEAIKAGHKSKETFLKP